MLTEHLGGMVQSFVHRVLYSPTHVRAVTCLCVCMCRARLCVRLPDDSETDTLREYQAGQCESSYVRTELYGGEQTCRQQHARCSRKCRPIPLLRRCFLLLRWPRQALRVTVWRPSVRLSVSYFSNFNRARGAYLL